MKREVSPIITEVIKTKKKQIRICGSWSLSQG